jgi:prevent-host-death family protein
VVAWHIEEATQHFSVIVKRALEEGPQFISRDGTPIVVVIAAEEYERLLNPLPSFKEFLLNGPDFSHLDLTRPAEPPRKDDV